MSTDDLTARARERARSLAQGSPRNPEGWPTTSALVSELADEVDRLRATEGICTHQNAQYLAMKAERDEARAEADRFRTLWDRHGKNDLLAERDAARAALERVRDVADFADYAAPSERPPYWTSHIREALEGES